MCSGSGVGDRECVREDLEVDDAVLNVPRVRVDGGRDNAGEVVGEVVGGVEAAVLGAVSPALPARCTAGKEAQAPGAAAPDATQGLYNQRHYLVTLLKPRVVVVAPVEGDAALACVVVKGGEAAAARGVLCLRAAGAAPEDRAVEALFGVAKGN